MSRQEIERRFVDAGWEIDGGFSEHLVIGYCGERVSLLAHAEVCGTNDPVFEVLDHEELGSSWVTELPSPQQAEQLVCLLRENGKPPEVWEQP